jgi:serine/threonine protein kinase
VNELLSRWHELQRQGQSLSPEALCAECPQLLPELKREIAALAAMEGFLGVAQACAGSVEEPSPTGPATRVELDGASLAEARQVPPAPMPPDDPEATRYTPLPPKPLAAAPLNWPAVPGYEILGILGRGGMGVVYRALDRRTGRVVALKKMQHRDGMFLELFKGEFRYLQGVAHPNLVQLYDLKSDGQEWLLTMELVEGVSFNDHISSCAEPSPPVATTDWVSTAAEAGQASCGLTPSQLNRLREALGQLAEGIAALHRHRRIHRDLKPQNVRVTPEGRVVILDFGLATDLGPTGEHLHEDQRLMGTLPYMAPEQGGTLPVSSPASDWYSVGVILYKTLTGRLPFTGNAMKVVQDKLRFDPPAPRDLRPDVPEDLNDLCVALLRRLPQNRPSGAEILERLGRKPSAPSAGLETSEATPLLGREQQLRFLDEAYETSRQRRAVLVAIHGPSGIGKSALVGHFLDRLRQGGAVVLAGRCYEHEVVPYKALDPLVDELGRYLRGLSHDEVELVLPRDVGPLMRVFPVLGRVSAVGEAAGRASGLFEPQELRHRAFAGLRELLTRVGERQALVLHIDDLQWGDIDSAYLLADLLQPPDPPPLLLLISYRSEDADSPCLRALAQVLGPGTTVDRRELHVAPLNERETRELVLGSLGAGAEHRAEEIARESGGNPFFITELVQEARSGGGQDAAVPVRGEITLDGLIRARVGRLPEGARRLLEVVAVSGRPLAELEAYRAAEVGADGRILMARLESARFLRGTGAAEEGCLETYHDRVRETVVRGLPPEPLRQHHQRLANVLEESGRSDPEEVGVHHEGAGNREKAGACYARAAERAAETLAFDQAANLYRRSLDLRPVTGAEGRELRAKLGNALANAGRGAEAGPVFLNTAEEAEATQALELRRRAAEQFLVSGRIGEGLDVLRIVLSAVGFRLLVGRARVLLGMLLERVRLRLRGLNFREREADSIPAEQLLRIDTCETAYRRLCMLDVPQSLIFQTRLLRLALQAGEPSRIALGLAGEAGFSTLGGSSGRPRAEEVMNTAMRLAERLDQPFLLAYTTFIRGLMAWAVGHWKESLALCERAEAIAAERQVSFFGERTKLQHFTIDCLALLGQWRELGRRLPGFLTEARRRGDRFAASMILVHSYVPRLAMGGPGDAEEIIRQAEEEWPEEGMFCVSFWALFGRAEAALYRGEGRRAGELIAQGWPALNRTTLVAYIEPLLLFFRHLRARAALGAAQAVPAGEWAFGQRARLLRSAARDARGIERRHMPWANPLAHLIRAGIAALRGQKEETLALFVAAEKEFAAADMNLYASVTRRRRGQLLGGEEGQALVDAADAWMREQEIREPARIAATLAPGFAD